MVYQNSYHKQRIKICQNGATQPFLSNNWAVYFLYKDHSLRLLSNMEKIYISIKNLSKIFVNPSKLWPNQQEKRGFAEIDQKVTGAQSATPILNFNLTVKKPEIVGIVGSKNSGKTTFFKLCLGFIQPTSGTINILGFQPYQRRQQFLYQIGFVNGNKYTSNINLTAKDSLLLSGYLYNLSSPTVLDRIDKLAQDFEFEDYLNVAINQFSTVEKIKFEIMTALLHSPKILFMDDVLSDLSQADLAKIQKLVKKYFEEENICMVVTSQKQETVESISHQIINI